MHTKRNFQIQLYYGMRKLKLGLIATLMSIVLGGVVQAQSGTTEPTLNKSLIPPSPEAASMAKYGIIPTTLYTGMANVSIPICELNSGALSAPVSISYNYNGFRPGEEASRVGLGWTLQGGGVITKIIRGLDDFSTNYANFKYHWQDLPDAVAPSVDMTYMDDLAESRIDGEPDLYIFNFNGHSGKFILTGDQNIGYVAYMFPRQDLVIKVNSAATTFTIIDETGITYEFSDIETTHTPFNTVEIAKNYTSAWFLTNVISADKSEKINFTYSTFNHETPRAYSDQYSIKSCAWCIANSGGCDIGNDGCDAYTSSSFSGGYVTTKLLTQISCDNGYVSFVDETATRQDLQGGSGYSVEHGLKEINLYSNASGLLKKATLTHGYFGTNARFKLNQIEIKGMYGGNETTPEKHVFEYNNETGTYPTQPTKDIDRFGYYNAKGNQMLFDASIVYWRTGTNTMLYTPANRDPDPDYGAMGMLNKITYPTGGYTTFEYEPNLIENPQACTESNTQLPQVNAIYSGTGTTGSPYILGNSSFVIEGCQGDEAPPIKVEFGQITSGNTFVKNFYSIVSIYYEGPYDNAHRLVYESPRLTANSKIEYVTLPPGEYSVFVRCENRSNSVHPESTYVKVTYFKKTTTDPGTMPGPGLRIKTVKSYVNKNSSVAAVPVLTKNYTYNVPATLFGAYNFPANTVDIRMVCTALDKSAVQTTFTSDYSTPLSTFMNDQLYYTSVTESNSTDQTGGKTVYEYYGEGKDALNINLIHQTDYKYVSSNNFKKVKETINSYSHKNLISFSAIKAVLYAMVSEPPACDFWFDYIDSPEPYDVMKRGKLYRPYVYTLNSQWSQLTQTDEITYDENATNSLTNTTNFYYNNVDYLQADSIVTTNSKGEKKITSLKFPLDYSGGLTTEYSPYYFTQSLNQQRAAAMVSFSDCWYARGLAADPEKTSTVNWNNTALKAVVNSYHCTDDFKEDFEDHWIELSTKYHQGFYYEPSTVDNTSESQNIRLMQSQNLVNLPVEVISSIKKGSTETVLGAVKTYYKANVQRVDVGTSTNRYGISPGVVSQTDLNQDLVSATFHLNRNSYYHPKINFTYQGSTGNVIEQSKVNDAKMSYVWDYKNQYAIAQATNASASDIAYTSFEGDGTGGFNSFSGTISTVSYQDARASNIPPTGMNYYNLGTGSLVKAGLTAGLTYTVSYWRKSTSAFTVSGGSQVNYVKGKTIGEWTLHIHTISTAGSGTVSLTISGTGTIDEVRIYPSSAQMTTYAYEPLIGLKSQSDINNRISYYEYDGMGRLKLIRDQDKNILKKYYYQIGSTTPSEIIPTCDGGTCALTAGSKCINGVCENVGKYITSSVSDGNGHFICTYHYTWSDGSRSPDLTMTSNTECTLSGGNGN